MCKAQQVKLFLIPVRIVGRKCSMSKANLHKLESVYANDVSKVNRIKTDGDPTWIYVKDFEIYLDNPTNYYYKNTITALVTFLRICKIYNEKPLFLNNNKYTFSLYGRWNVCRSLELFAR